MVLNKFGVFTRFINSCRNFCTVH